MYRRTSAASSSRNGWGWPSSTTLSSVRDSCRVITVLMRYEHHVDHTFLEATHYRADEGVLTVHLGDEEVACFPAGSWDGVYKHDGNRVREKDGRERTAQRLEVQLSVADQLGSS